LLQVGELSQSDQKWKLEQGEIFTDIIGLYSTTVTYLAISKAIEFGHLDEKREITAITPIKDRGQTANQSTTLLYTGKRSRGRPCKKWINNIQEDLNCVQLNMKEAMDIVRDRQEWRHRISTSSSPLG